MLTASSRSRTASGSVIWTGSSAPVRMCQLVLLVSLLSIHIQASSQAPPRLSSCRTIHKVKGNQDYVFSPPYTCDQTVILPLEPDSPTNVTDTRNCENYFKCIGASCDQCPCPVGETFNPVTMKCDSTNAPCACPVVETTPIVVTTTPTTIAPKTTTIKTTTMRTPPPQIIQGGASNAGTGSQQGGDNSNIGNAEKPVSTEVIIIAGIVSATVIVIVVIVMGVFCWQRRHSAQNNARACKPVNSNGSKKLSSPSPDNYSTSIAPTERHEYAEIDERMINGRKHWQHGGSLRAPPLPNHQPPPTSPAFTGVCPHQHARSDSGLGSADTSFTANYPRRTFQPINPAHTIQVGIPYNERQPGTCCCDELYHNQEDSSASSDSQYSNPVSVDSRDVDLKTPLHKQNYVSKQVYI